MWKARCLRFAEALWNVLDGVQEHDLPAMTGLSESECKKIAKAKADAVELLTPNV